MKRSLSPSVKRSHRRSRSDSSMLQIAQGGSSRRNSAGSTDGISPFEAHEFLTIAEDDYSLDYMEQHLPGTDSYIRLGGPGQPDPVYTFQSFDTLSDKGEAGEGARRRSSSGNSTYNLFGTPQMQAELAPTKTHRRVQSEPPDSSLITDTLDDFEVASSRLMTSAGFSSSCRTENQDNQYTIRSARESHDDEADEEDDNGGDEEEEHHVDRGHTLSSTDFGQLIRGSTNSADWDENLIPNPENNGHPYSRLELPPAPAAIEVFPDGSASFGSVDFSNGMVRPQLVTRKFLQNGASSIPVYNSRVGSEMLNSSGRVSTSRKQHKVARRRQKGDGRKGSSGKVVSMPSGVLPGMLVKLPAAQPTFYQQAAYGADKQLFPQFAALAAGSATQAGKPLQNKFSRSGSTSSLSSDPGTGLNTPGMFAMSPTPGSYRNRGRYKCGKCGQLKANHKCPFDAPPSRSVHTQVDLRLTKHGHKIVDTPKERVIKVNRNNQWAVESATSEVKDKGGPKLAEGAPEAVSALL